MQPRLQPSFLLAWAMAFVFGVCSLWILSEQDIYWQIRAGDDLWRTGSFPHTDTWSFSVPGAPWQNIQWLSTLIFRGIYALGAETALIVARGVLVMFLFATLGVTVTRAMCRDGEGNEVSEWLRCAAVAGLLPLSYLALSARLQIRSDLLVTLVCALLVQMWVVDRPLVWKRRSTVGLVLLAANLHAGTAPFVLVLALAFLVSTADVLQDSLKWCCGALVAFFVTPYHVTVLPLLWAHLDYAHHNILPNPDHVAFGLHILRTHDGIAVGMGWLLLMAASLLALEPTNRQRRTALVAYQRSPITLAVWLLLALLSFNRMRSIPYHVLFMVPLVAAIVPLWRPSRSASVATCACIAALFTMQVRSMAPLWGFGVNDGLFPVGSVAYLQRAHPQPNLLHTFAYGAYTVWNLRAYPVYVDTRETMYWPLQPEILSAYHSPEITQALVRKYDINTMLMPIPQTRYVPAMGFEDVLAKYVPQSQWALLYFDRLSVVMVRRIPEHAQLIADHEYQLLRPNLPANLYSALGKRTAEQDARYEQELARCLGDEPTNAYCLIAQAAWWRVQGDKSHARDAVTALQTAQGTLAANSSQVATLMVELQLAYAAADMPEAAARVAASMEPGTVMEAPER